MSPAFKVWIGVVFTICCIYITEHDGKSYYMGLAVSSFLWGIIDYVAGLMRKK